MAMQLAESRAMPEIARMAGPIAGRDGCVLVLLIARPNSIQRAVNGVDDEVPGVRGDSGQLELIQIGGIVF
jgi:hypothetical protein